MPSARSWSVYEGSCSTLLPNPALVADFASDRVALGLARIEAHYFRNDIFLPPGFLLREVGRLKEVPAVIMLMADASVKASRINSPREKVMEPS